MKFKSNKNNGFRHNRKKQEKDEKNNNPSQLYSKNMALDIGTSNLRILVKGKGVVLNQPSVLAFDKYSREVLATGNEAKNYLGRTPHNIDAVKPIKEGSIVDFEASQALIKDFFYHVKKSNLLFNPKLLIPVKISVTNVEKKTLYDAARESGFSKVFFIEDSIAAAIGDNIDIESNHGKMIVNIGGGSTSISVITLSSLAYGEVINSGGEKIDKSIINYLIKNHNIHVGENSAEHCKIVSGSILNSYGDLETYTISGKDILNSTPKEINLTPQELRSAITEPVKQIITGLKNAMDKISPELVSDIYKEGIYITGGSSLLRGIDKTIENDIKIKCKKINDPITNIINGCGIVLEKMKKYKKILSCK